MNRGKSENIVVKFEYININCELLQLSLFTPITICKHMMLLAISLALSAMLNCVEKMGISIVTDSASGAAVFSRR